MRTFISFHELSLTGALFYFFVLTVVQEDVDLVMAQTD